MNKFNFSEEKIRDQLLSIKRKAGGFSLLRLALFLAIIAAVVLFFSQSGWWFFILIAIGGGFVWSVREFNFLKDQEAVTLALAQMKKETKWRVDRKLDSLEEGKAYLDKNHPYSNDLDLFGDHSLFQLLNHCHSMAGSDLLAEALKAPIEIGKKSALREAVDELSQNPLFLKSMEAVGKAFYNDSTAKADWSEWLKVKEKPKSYLLALGGLGILGGVFLLVSLYLGWIPSAVLGLWILIGMVFLASVFSSLKEAAEKIPNRQTLKTFFHSVKLIEEQEFESSFLREQQEIFKEKAGLASLHLLELDRLGLWVQNRLNLMYLPINLILWTDLLLYVRWVKWKNRFGDKVAAYPERLAYWEMLISLGLFQHQLGTQGDVEIAADQVVKAEELTHPLLVPGKAVANSFELGGDKRIVLLTGANMSGKTTFMRTIGINLVLANLGLRPYGKRLVVGEMDLYTSMRNADNLGESVSSFYAELSRIKSLITRLEQGKPIFFLLDEILKGTNTEDRIAGSEALIRQLIQTEGLGIISTHDIELSSLENRLGPVTNKSFHSAVFDDKIDFDYKIKEGPCPSFNAHKLMELMGIKFGGNSGSA